MAVTPPHSVSTPSLTLRLVTIGLSAIPANTKLAMTFERKIMIAVCALCLIAAIGALIALAFMTDVGLGLIAVALVAWWLGTSIAEVLKNNPEKPSQ